MTTGKIIAAGGILGGIVAIGLGTWRLFAGPDRPLKNIEPDALPQAPALGKTGYKRVDAILDKLRAVAQSTGIPLGLMIGWIAKESGGKLATKPQPGPGDTSLDERGIFQLHPEESKALGLDHQRLSVDLDYSIDAGIKLIRKYQSLINNFDLLAAPAGREYYWKLVKLAHSMGSGQTKKVVTAAKAAGQVGSWEQLKDFAMGMKINGPQPKKWMPFVDVIYGVGRPFGFGSAPALVAGSGRPPQWSQLTASGLDYLGVEVA